MTLHLFLKSCFSFFHYLSLFLFFHFFAGETVSWRRDHLLKRTSFDPSLNHPSVAKVVKQTPLELCIGHALRPDGDDDGSWWPAKGMSYEGIGMPLPHMLLHPNV
jgi:hypothetical protein